MSKEAMGENGAILGKGEYWSRVNQSTIFGGLMRDPARTNYHETLQEVGSRANGAVEEIYEDLRKHADSVSAIPAEQRSALAKQVQALYDVCRISGGLCFHSRDCIGMLELSAFYLGGSPFRDESAIQRAIQAIKSCTDFFVSECLELIQKAVDWGESFAAGNNEKKRAFLKEVSQGKDREFLREVLRTYRNSSGEADLRGACGYPIGSREYRAYMERKIFPRDLSVMYHGDYAGAIKNALDAIARQLKRDLSQNERENNYIRNETVSALRAAVRELERCDVNTGIPDTAITCLDWFVGGDPEKIRKEQQLLNETGLAPRLLEDGVYGKKTQEAEEHVVDQLITKLEEFLLNTEEVKKVTDRISRILKWLSLIERVSPHSKTSIKITNALFSRRKSLQRLIWTLGAEYFLRPQGYEVAALLLEHSLRPMAGNLYFMQNHWVVQKIIKSKGFQQAYSDLERKIKQDPAKYAVSGSMGIDFQDTGDTDLYYGIGKCKIEYTCVRWGSTVQIDFRIEDEYDFDELRTISGDAETFIKFNIDVGPLANDAGLLSQADTVITPYKSFINFQKTIELGGARP